MKTVNQVMQRTAKHLGEAITHAGNDLIARTKKPVESLQFVVSSLLVSVCNIVVSLAGRQAEDAPILHQKLVEVLNEFTAPPVQAEQVEALVKPVFEVEKPKLFIPGGNN